MATAVLARRRKQETGAKWSTQLDLNSKSPITFSLLQRARRNLRRAAAFLTRNCGLAWLRSSRVDQFQTRTFAAQCGRDAGEAIAIRTA
jgi:hypothetical protein